MISKRKGLSQFIASAEQMNLVVIILAIYHLKTYVLLQINFKTSSLNHGRIIHPRSAQIQREALAVLYGLQKMQTVASVGYLRHRFAAR